MSAEAVGAAGGDEVTPEGMMEHFRGPGLVKMVLVTAVVHALVILGSSIPFLKRTLLGSDVSQLTRDERVEKAMADATASLRQIAAANGLNPQDISERLAAGRPRGTPAAAAAPAATVTDEGAAAATTTPAVAPSPAAAPERPESRIEKDMKTAVEGPKMPDAVDKDDIF